MFALLVAVLASLPVSIAAEPTFMRTPESPLMPFEEVGMGSGFIPNGCGYSNWCVSLINQSRNWVAVEIGDKGSSHIDTNRVWVDGPMITGVYINQLPQIVDMVPVTLNNQTTMVPAIIGTFISAIPPCRDLNAIPHGHVKVDDSSTMTVATRSLYFDGNDKDLTPAWDVVKGVLVNVPLGGYAHMGANNARTFQMWTENGNPTPGFEPWGGINIGNSTCRN